MGKLVNRAFMTVASAPGTGAITLGLAIAGFQTFASAGVNNGDVVSYAINDGNNWEVGQGTYSSTGPTLARTTVQDSSSSGAAINVSASASVMVAALAGDLSGTLAGPVVVTGFSVPITTPSTGWGSIALSGGSAANTGWMGFYNSAGTRLGFIGYAPNSSWIALESENGALGYQVIGALNATGVISNAAGIQAGVGYASKAGYYGAYTSNWFNLYYYATSGQTYLYIDATQMGYISVVSDHRIKKDITPLPSMWERTKTLRPISYTHKNYGTRMDGSGHLVEGDNKERWGFVAHELQEDLIPEAASGVKDQKDVLQSPNPWTVIAALTKALQEAMERIEALEAKVK